MERMVVEERSVTDSPWFWVCLFATAALIGLAAIGPKYAKRQAQIEREFQGRQRAAQNVQGQTPSVALSTPEQTLITLRPLIHGHAEMLRERMHRSLDMQFRLLFCVNRTATRSHFSRAGTSVLVT